MLDVDNKIAMFFFFFNDTATTEIYTLSLHDALPISRSPRWSWSRPTTSRRRRCRTGSRRSSRPPPARPTSRSARTSRSRSDRKSTRPELQSRQYLVCRLLLEKKKNLFYHTLYNLHHH